MDRLQKGLAISCDYIEINIKLVSILSRNCQTFSGRSDHIIHRPGALKSRIEVPKYLSLILYRVLKKKKLKNKEKNLSSWQYERSKGTECWGRWVGSDKMHFSAFRATTEQSLAMTEMTPLITICASFYIKFVFIEQNC